MDLIKRLNTWGKVGLSVACISIIWGGILFVFWNIDFFTSPKTLVSFPFPWCIVPFFIGCFLLLIVGSHCDKINGK